MGEASVRAWGIIRQKLSYWSKALSEDAMWSTLAQTFNVFDWLSFFSDITLSDTLFSSLVSSFLLDINLLDLEPWNLNWTIELPTLEEFARGVLIKLEPIGISDLAPELLEALKDYTLFLEPRYGQTVRETKLEKGIYGKSRYGQCYYDPQAVREFLRSTAYAFTKKGYDVRTARDLVDQSAKALNVNPELARTVFNRLSAITAVKYEALTWDYGWWDLTYWGREGSGGLLEYVNYELQVQEVPYENLFEQQGGGFWDDACWDYFYWLEEVPEPTHPYRVEDYNVARAVDKIWYNFRGRISATPLAVANYQTYEERVQPTASLRLETFALPTSQRHILEGVAEKVVASKELGVDPIRMRLYKSAVLQLFGDLTSAHRWGTGMQLTMSEDELRSWWVGSWSAKGLDPDVLNELYDRVRDTVETFVSLRQRERVRFLRRRLVGR